MLNDSGTVRRLVALGLGLLVPFLNKFLQAKLGVSLGETEVAAVEVAITGYIVGSNLKEGAAKKGEAAAAAVTDKATAIEELKR